MGNYHIISRVNHTSITRFLGGFITGNKNTSSLDKDSILYHVLSSSELNRKVFL